jgi:hypothetical protein
MLNVLAFWGFISDARVESNVAQRVHSFYTRETRFIWYCCSILKINVQSSALALKEYPGANRALVGMVSTVDFS